MAKNLIDDATFEFTEGVTSDDVSEIVDVAPTIVTVGNGIKCYKALQKVVCFYGSGAIENSRNTVATLGSGYRPSTSMVFPATITLYGLNDDSRKSHPCAVNVDTDGTIKVDYVDDITDSSGNFDTTNYSVSVVCYGSFIVAS